MLKIELKCLI